MEGMPDGEGLWKERKQWEEDGRNAGRIVEGRKGMGGRLGNAGWCNTVEGKKGVGGRWGNAGWFNTVEGKKGM